MAREDYTHKMVNGERVDLTSDEIDALVKAEEDWAAGLVLGQSETGN